MLFRESLVELCEVTAPDYWAIIAEEFLVSSPLWETLSRGGNATGNGELLASIIARKAE